MEKYTDERKYSLINREVKENLDKMKTEGVKGLCFDKFKADFVIDDDIQTLKVGDEIKVNDISMVITKVGKNCYPKDCDLYKNTGKPCMLAKGIMFAK